MRESLHDNASMGEGGGPVEGEAGLGEEGRAEGEGGSAGYVGALVEEVGEDGVGCEVGAEVVLGGEVELEEGVEEEGVGGVVPGVAAGAGGEGEGAEARLRGAELGGEALAGDFGNPVADEVLLRADRDGRRVVAGDDGVGVLVVEGCGDGAAGFDLEVELGALGEDLAEVLAFLEVGGEEDGGDGAIDFGPEVCAGEGDGVGG
jgi:hypothetical protein